MLLEISWLFLLVAFMLAWYVLQYHTGTNVEKEEHQLVWYQSRRQLSIRCIYLFLFLSSLLLLLHAVLSTQSTTKVEHNSTQV